MGFLEVDKLSHLCRTTKWTTYKVWQAVKAGDLTYTPVTYMRSETALKDALKQMITKNIQYAVIKKGNREVGMIGEARLRECLNRESAGDLEESKDSSYIEYMQNRFNDWRTGRESKNVSHDSSASAGAFLNRISKDNAGNELSRISVLAENLNSLDSDDRNDIESCQITT